MAEEEDIEARRQALKARRWRLGHPAERAAWMAAIAEKDPALHAELEVLRRASAQEWRKRLVREARRLGVIAEEGAT